MNPLKTMRLERKKGCEVYVPHPPPFRICALTLRQRISNWYKEERKKTKHGAALPYSNPAPNLIDLSGKLKCKKLPYKLHQAFSILYWRPPDSPLRLEVESFWTRRREDSVHEILKPFLKEAVKTSTSSSEKLVFHMAVMRWKCSLLTPDELTMLQDWIDEQHKSKEKIRSLPWSDEASEHGDTLFTENTYTQWYAVQTSHREPSLTLHPIAPSTTSHPQYSGPLRRSSN
jgi:hypothetical protein